MHMIVSKPPLLRIDGRLTPVDDMLPLTPKDMEEAFRQVTTDKERSDFERNLELDFGRTVPDVGRLRFNAAKQRGTISLVIRLLPPEIPTIPATKAIIPTGIIMSRKFISYSTPEECLRYHTPKLPAFTETVLPLNIKAADINSMAAKASFK